MQLPEHEVILRDAVFAQPTPDFVSKYITVVNLYQQSKPSETWDYLNDKVAGLAAVVQLGHKPQTELENLISKLPESVLNNFSDFKDEFQPFVLGDIEEDAPALRFLEVSYGVLPLEELAEGNGNPYWYVRLMQGLRPDEEDEIFSDYGLGEIYHIGIIVDNNTLPSREDLILLASHMTSESRTLSVCTMGYNPEEVIEIINRVYKAVEGNLEKLTLVQELEDLSVSSMRGILAYLKGEEYDELSDFPEPHETDLDH